MESVDMLFLNLCRLEEKFQKQRLILTHLQKDIEDRRYSDLCEHFKFYTQNQKDVTALSRVIKALYKDSVSEDRDRLCDPLIQKLTKIEEELNLFRSSVCRNMEDWHQESGTRLKDIKGTRVKLGQGHRVFSREKQVGKLLDIKI